MRKIPSYLENPFDNFAIEIARITSPFYKSLNFTPNTLTTISLVFSIVSAIFFYHNYYEAAVIFFIISYIYDCTDGFYARKYGMTSKFGDLYDHVSDWFKIALISFVMYKKNSSKFIKYVPFMLVLITLMIIQFGCQETLHNDDEQPFMAKTKLLCIGNPYDIMYFTRFFGNGTFILIFAFLMYSFKYD
jgi:phosphatidylglycerophosphate synthase